MPETTSGPAPRARVSDRRTARTIAALWRASVSQPRQTPAYLVEENGDWREVSWAEAARRVDELAHGLLALGIKKGDAFAILARTQLEWALLDFALISIGAVVVPIYPASSDADCRYILGHSDAVGLAVESEEEAARLVSAGAELPKLTHVIPFSQLGELAERGRAHAETDPRAVESAASAIAECDLLTCVYTSGTTGPPKGCLLTHSNYYAMTTMIEQLPGLSSASDRLLLYLPLAHTFGRLVHFWGPRAGLTIAFCPDPKMLGSAMERVQPTLLPSVPRVYEKVHAAVEAQLDAATGPKRKLVDWSLAVGRRVSRLRQDGRPLPPALALQHRIADRLLFSKVKKKLGGRLRHAISGGAALSREIAEFFHALDILILEGYGLTECTTACAVNLPERFRFGTVGRAMPGCDVRRAADGEILIRGETVFAGYLKDEEATRAAVTEDGWLMTGDVGEIDRDGFITITDRKKDLLVTAGGKNVSPQNIENALKRSRHVSQALAVGDRRPYVAALITLDEDEARGWAKARGLDADVSKLAANPELRRVIQDVVDDVNARLSPFERVKRFAILPRDFSQEEGEVTPTLKLKRRVCEQHFAAEIEELYSNSRNVRRR